MSIEHVCMCRFLRYITSATNTEYIKEMRLAILSCVQIILEYFDLKTTCWWTLNCPSTMTVEDVNSLLLPRSLAELQVEDSVLARLAVGSRRGGELLARGDRFPGF